MSAGARPLRTRRYRALRLAVLDRDLWLCQVKAPGCTRYACHVDHVIPRHEGGPVYDPANMRAACAHCNLGRRRPTGISSSRPASLGTTPVGGDYASRF